MGGIDNIWNHEWRAKLPASPTARRELRLHAARGLIYGPVFLAFAWAELRGLFAAALLAILAIELVITLADFVEEDRSRRLSPQERVLHVGGQRIALAFPPQRDDGDVVLASDLDGPGVLGRHRGYFPSAW